MRDALAACGVLALLSIAVWSGCKVIEATNPTANKRYVPVNNFDFDGVVPRMGQE